ncbi:MAG TPA: hypothetical protein VMV76_05635 [Dehalococcoidia bacterium]|nr:hypothetical protein [Dehalococcoidia bacterium]
MSEISVNVGVLSIPENRIWSIICWLPRKLSGTNLLIRDVHNLTQHVSAMTEVFHMIIADVTGDWSANKRERVQKMIAKFTLVCEGLDTVVPKENPFNQEELDTLRTYTLQAQQGQIFTPEQATQFRELSERASREYPNQDWVKELLKIALFVFAVYAFVQLLKSD